MKGKLLLFSVLGGRNAELRFECPIEGGIVLKSHGNAHLIHGQSAMNQNLGFPQTPHGDIAIEADAHFLAEQLADGTLTDPESGGNVGHGDPLGKMGLHIAGDPVQQLRFGGFGVLCALPESGNLNG